MNDEMHEWKSTEWKWWMKKEKLNENKNKQEEEGEEKKVEWMSWGAGKNVAFQIKVILVELCLRFMDAICYLSHSF